MLETYFALGRTFISLPWTTGCALFLVPFLEMKLTDSFHLCSIKSPDLFF